MPLDVPSQRPRPPKRRRTFRPPPVPPTPGWEKDPKPVPNGTLIVGRCRNGQGIPIYVKDSITPEERLDAFALKPDGVPDVLPPCRHCGKPYEAARKLRPGELGLPAPGSIRAVA